MNKPRQSSVVSVISKVSGVNLDDVEEKSSSSGDEHGDEKQEQTPFRINGSI